ncbi:hypothetical protein [Anaerospora sp.]|uniref:hypothetical protein n=1 Tax=Anaerospora sp. TaxID=1960278 RepID=UPI00289D32A2|nr:hypothetical protein [Anaerospora sp.]
MSNTQAIVDVLKDYFDNAVLIDDQLYTVKENITILDEIADEEIIDPEDIDNLEEFNNTESTMSSQQEINDAYKQMASIITTTLREQDTGIIKEYLINKVQDNDLRLYFHGVPRQTHQAFIRAGIITHPYWYDYRVDVTKHLANLKPILTSAKALILDWELEEGKIIANKKRASERILDKFLKLKKGLKCVIIYTQANLNEVADVLCRNNKYLVTKKDDSYFFEEKGGQDGKGLIGFVISKKKVMPKRLLNSVAEQLCNNKVLTLHFIAKVNTLNENLRETVQQYNAPFERVLLTQAITSGASNLSDLVKELLLENLDNTDSTVDPFEDYIKTKLNKVKDKVLGFPLTEQLYNEQLNVFKEIYHVSDNVIKDILKKNNQAFIKGLQEQFRQREELTLDCLRNIIQVEAKKIKSDIEETYLKQLLFCIIFLGEFNETNTLKRAYENEVNRFTKNMKYSRNVSKVTRTGDIFVRQVDGIKQYIFCITPFCDTVRPEKIECYYKFLKGKELQLESKYLKTYLKNSDKNFETMAVPEINSNKVVFVKWDFYNVQTLSQDELTDWTKVASLKKTYTQRVINKYIAYQVRAGVEELFFKESAFSGVFSSVFS